MDWPRVPILRNAEMLKSSSTLGYSLAALLTPEHPVQGITSGVLRPELRHLAAPSKHGEGSLSGRDFSLTVRWGSLQGSGIVMPGRGNAQERAYREDELAAFDAGSETLAHSRNEILDLLGETTFDVYLNDDAYWANVPAKVWTYTLGGYQVIKKWLSYREHGVFGRALKPEEVAYVSEMVRRVAAILLLGPALDANYEAAKADAVPWVDGRPVLSESV